ncbi:MBL fold metallo-hydrolase [Rubinisphaera italica]|uniref:Putative quorum-quenching lactonase YtnP n=1 Tax=Rubinisphaera italica TaxID=2527969 RepID=A0A5C5XJP4_9PLAN|nr:MBL fold metallo-hydrolase [Rubinisphaera italica]TWT62601.1 putative quorum-quenching lactonase YtnP [Rubinisphaera italica]
MSSNAHQNNSMRESQRSENPRNEIQIGEFRLRPYSGGQYWIDGGTIFGVVPKTLWQKHYEPDSDNRILQETNCFLIETDTQKILLDTGYGTKLPEKFRTHHRIEQGNWLLDNLERHQISPESIDIVILSHLHFDHAGGCTRFNSKNELQPTFPNARYVVNHLEWDIANSQLPELRGSYIPDDFSVLEKSGQLQLVEDREMILPGITVWETGGHSVGHQSVLIESKNEGALFAGDLCATAAHQQMAWCMSYDVNLLQTRRMKTELLKMATENQWWLLFDHDPFRPALQLGV